jgi:hypothetical protein
MARDLQVRLCVVIFETHGGVLHAHLKDPALLTVCLRANRGRRFDVGSS